MNVTLGQARAVLGFLGVEAEPYILEGAVLLAPEVERDRGAYTIAWDVDGHRLHGRRLDVEGLYCNCRAAWNPPCVHRVAVILAQAWSDPQLRPLFTRPAWEIALLPFAGEPAAAKKPAREGHRGFVRYDVVSDSWDQRPRVERKVIRFSRRGGKTLKPMKCPVKLVDLESRITDLTDADRDFHRASEQLDEVRKLMQRAWTRPSAAQRRVLGEIEAMWIRALAAVDRVFYDDVRIEVDATPVRPRMVADEDDTGVDLRWEPAVLKVWDDYVLTADRVLRPLDFEQPELLRRELPRVPTEDVERFVDHYVLAGRLPFQIGGARVVDGSAGREARLVLSEDDGALLLRPEFAYAVGDSMGVVEADDPSPFVKVDREGLNVVGRDADWEARKLAELPARRYFRGDAAFDFLSGELSEIAESWSVYGREGLLRHRLQGTATATVTVPSNTDWFDLDVEFKVRGHHVPTKDILRSWLNGRKYVRLADGAVARLPDTWMKRHGAALAELDDLGRAGAWAVPLARELLEEASGDAARWLGLADRLAGVQGLPDVDVPEGLPLRDYQVDGFRWLVLLRQLGLGGCLADDMGLGKTIQALAALAHAHPSDRPSLVVAPTSVVFNWAREAERFVPWLRVHVHHGPRRGDIPDDVDLVVTTYALLRTDSRLAREWDHVVLDEAQAIKNPTSKVARAARELDARTRIALTGTPLENTLHELWSIYQFLMPGFFGSHAAFTRRYATPVHRHQSTEALTALRQRIRPFLLRRLKEEVAHELPPRQEVVLYVELDAAHRALYESVKETYRHTVLTSLQTRSLHILEALTRLRQACCHPDLLPFEEASGVVGSPKLDLLEHRLEEGIADGHRSLVFSQWPTLLQRVAARLDERGWPYLYLDGSTTNRGKLVDEFNDPDGPPVFLISLKAGGTGLNLTAADHVFHLDPWWNPQAEAQATDRAHRIGQTRPVVSYKIVARGTVEEKVLELQQRKRALFEAAVDTDRLVAAELTRDDLESVFA